MKLHLDKPTASNIIHGYAPGEVKINDEVITRSLVVMPEQLIRDWPPQQMEELSETHLEVVAALEPEVVLLGTGKRLTFPPAKFTAFFLARGIGLEVMDTAAACRTYNILMAEDRKVAAALLMI
jgi:Uncharacterized conserved protein